MSGEAVRSFFIHVSYVTVILVAGGIEVLRENQIEVVEVKSVLCEDFGDCPVRGEVVLQPVNAEPVGIGNNHHGQCYVVFCTKLANPDQLTAVFLRNGQILQRDRGLVPFRCLVPGDEGKVGA